MHFGRTTDRLWSGVRLLWPILLLMLLLELLALQPEPCSALQSKQKQGSDNKTAAAATETGGRQPEVGGGLSAKRSETSNGSAATSTSNKHRQQDSTSSSSADISGRGSGKRKRKPKRPGECEYERGPWEECQTNGSQRRTLKLKAAAGLRRNQRPELSCEPIKTIERDCKLVGCKYARGEWSNSCADGKRSRIDTLLGTLGPPAARGANRSSRCPAKRTVTKECRRTCHYMKSAWSDCINGFKTRNLTLDSSLLPGSTNGSDGRLGDDVGELGSGLGCLRERFIRRPCRLQEPANNNNIKQAPPLSGTSTAATSRQVPGSKVKSAAQKRRLQKQQKLQQQQQPQPQKVSGTNNMNNNNNNNNGTSSNSAGSQEPSNGMKQRRK